MEWSKKNFLPVELKGMINPCQMEYAQREIPVMGDERAYLVHSCLRYVFLNWSDYEDFTN